MEITTGDKYSSRGIQLISSLYPRNPQSNDMTPRSLMSKNFQSKID